MAVIDSDAVQMPHGECKIEMNVTDRTGLVLYINGLGTVVLTGREG